MIDKARVLHIASLARLSITEAEADGFGPQLNSVLAYMEKLGELDTSAVQPMSCAIGLVNVTRPDEKAPCLSAPEALANAPDRVENKSGGFFYRVPRIID